VLADGTNTVELCTRALPGVSWQFSMVYSLALTYTRKLEGPGPLKVAAGGGDRTVYEARGLATDEVYVVDRTEEAAPRLVGYGARREADGTWTVRFKAWPGRTYEVVPRGSEKRPVSVTLRYIEPLKGGTAYLAVGGGLFESALKPLLEQRTKEGLAAEFAEQERVFDAYGHGRYGPEGIRRAVRLVKPRYLLLVGSTKYDYRNYEGQTADRGCPTFLAKTSTFSQAPGDPLFGDLGRGYPEVAVGRYPAKDGNELSVAVGRALSYTRRQNESGPWALMVADRADVKAGDFAAQAEEIVQATPEYDWERAYLGVTDGTVEAVREKILAAGGGGGGADVIGYVGHGSAARLGQERLVTTATAGQWTGNVVLVMATCNGTYFLMDVKTLARVLLFQEAGGAAAMIGPATYVYAEAAAPVTKAVLKESQRAGARWGEALLAAQRLAARRAQGKAGMWDDLAKTETLLGDPALPVEKAAAKPAPIPPPRTHAGSF
jgi:hypothetical protein